MKRIISLALCAVLLLLLLPAISQPVLAERINNFNIRLNEPVASYRPDFTPEFNTNAYIIKSVTWQENSAGFSAKLGEYDEFRAGLAYKVEIWIRFGDGSYLATNANGDLDATITVNNKPISSLKINERDSQNRIKDVTITCEYGPLPGMAISNVMITGVPTPVEGQMPIYSFSLQSSSYGYYHTAPVVWWDMTTGEEMDSGDNFIKGHKYQVNIWLQANRQGGFTFKTDGNGNPQVSAVINSWAADSVTKAYEQEGREVIDIRYTFPACQPAHTCAPQLVPQQDPTCLMSGFKAYYACSCGKNFADAAGNNQITDMDGYGIIPANGHKEGGWSYNGTHHYVKCTVCKEVIPGTNAAHSGGTASCLQKAKCTTCGQEYGAVSSEHSWGSSWGYKDAKGHALVCADCKTCDKLKSHNPGPAATDKEPQKCKDCGYIITPAKNHTHKLTKVEKVPATCIQEGTEEHYTCNGCSKKFSDKAGKKEISNEASLTIGALGHETGDDWGMDEQFHWRSCKVCKAILEETKMQHELVEEKCSTCSYQAGMEIPEQTQDTEPVTEETEPETKPAKQDIPKDTGKKQPAKKNLGWLIILAVVLVCFGAAAAVTVIILKKKKVGNGLKGE